MAKPRRATTGTNNSQRRRRLAADDTLVSGAMLTLAVDAILKWARLDRKHDVPYLAGYSRDGRTIYIDKDLPKTFTTRRGRRVKVDPFLIFHEAVGKALLGELDLICQHAPQI